MFTTGVSRSLEAKSGWHLSIKARCCKGFRELKTSPLLRIVSIDYRPWCHRARRVEELLYPFFFFCNLALNLINANMACSKEESSMIEYVLHQGKEDGKWLFKKSLVSEFSVPFL